MDCTSLSEIVIPYGVAEIGVGAFSGCTSLTDIDLPESLTEIHDCAFQNCENLNDIVFPDSLEYVVEEVFAGTKLLGRKTDGDFLIIDDVLCAYTGNSDVIYIPDGVRVVTGDCFLDCYNGVMPFTEGASIIFPDSVEVISNTHYMYQYSEVFFKGDVKVMSPYDNVYIYLGGNNDTRMSDIYLTEPIPIDDTVFVKGISRNERYSRKYHHFRLLGNCAGMRGAQLRSGQKAEMRKNLS